MPVHLRAKIAQKASALTFRFLLSLNAGLQIFERISLKENSSHAEPGPIFILGAPRSGTTLSYQIISNFSSLQPFTNLHCKWFGAPFLVSNRRIPKNRLSADTLSSIHGRTFGDASPSECGLWWGRFFPVPEQIYNKENLSANRKGDFQRSVALLRRRAKKPLVFKNVYLSLRIEVIDELFPDCLFVVVSRNVDDIVRSILKAREDTTGSQSHWFSVRPPGMKTDSVSNPEDEVREQVERTHQIIRDSLGSSAIPDRRVFHLSYENLCENPKEVVGNLAVFLESSGVSMAKWTNEVPPTLSRPPGGL